MEAADWIGVGLVVLGLVLIGSAFFVRKTRKGNSGIEGHLHPTLAKDLEQNDEAESIVADPAADQPQELEQPVPGANSPQA